MIAAFVVGILVIALYIDKIGISNLKLMYTLSTTDKIIASMEETDGHYLTKLKRPDEVIKERMNIEGWKYVQHEGSSYFFEKENQKAIVTTTIWHRNYVKILVQNNVVNIAD
jgi:hypothetical protein